MMAKRIAKKVVWVGWDAADWKVINPLIDKGLMPNLERLINGGVMGNLATLDPPMSPTLWTAMSTGKRPYKHGIYGFTEIDPTGEGVRPSYITSRKVKAIWNMLMHHDLVTHQVGWWPSHPAEPTNGIYISNFWHKAGKNPNNWPMKEGCVHPQEMEDVFKDLRIHPSELTHAHIQPFIPLGYEIDMNDPQMKGLINSVIKITCDAACIQAAATHIMANHEYDLMCVYFDAIDHYGHGFMKYHPPRRPHIPEHLFKYFSGVINAGYRYHDMILGRLMQLAGDEATFILVSDHGFHPDHLRPTSLPVREEPAAPALEHSPFGIIVANGPGIKKDERIYGASLIDMCPTILSLFGLPVAKDFDGKVLMNLFEKPIEIDLIESWEQIEGPCGQHEKEEFIDTESAKEEMQQLIDLGYIEDPGDNKEKALENTRKTNKYFMARAFVDGGRIEDALPLYQELWEEYRDNTRFGIRLANCYMSLDMIDEARLLLEEIRELKLSDTPSLLILDGMLLLREKKWEEAFQQFKEAVSRNPKGPGLNLQAAKGCMKLGKFENAESYTLKELDINFENSEAHKVLGDIYYKSKDFEKSANCYLTAIGLRYHSPQAHFGLGLTLERLEYYEKAAEAFQVAIHQYPRFLRARKALIRLYKTKLSNPHQLQIATKELEQVLDESPTILVVSGFRRAGSSLLMHQLNEAGVNLYADDSRQPDEHNKLGYFEHRNLSNIRFDKSFLAKIPTSNIIKIYASEIPFLPRRFNYKVVFVERNHTQIIEERMLEQGIDIKKIKTIPVQPLLHLKRRKLRIKKWMDFQKNVDVLFIDHKSLLERPQESLRQVSDFYEL